MIKQVPFEPIGERRIIPIAGQCPTILFLFCQPVHDALSPIEDRATNRDSRGPDPLRVPTVQRANRFRQFFGEGLAQNISIE
jgi:hypothetical protein